MIMRNLKLIKKLLKIIYKIKKKDSLIQAKKKQLIIYTLNKMNRRGMAGIKAKQEMQKQSAALGSRIEAEQLQQMTL